MRLRSVWTRAAMLPVRIVRAARTQRAGPQSTLAPTKAMNRKRAKAAKAAALTPVAMNAVIGTGAPW